jgi:hypothetical protein
MNIKYVIRLMDQEPNELVVVNQEAEGDEREGAARPASVRGRRGRPELDRPSDRRGVLVLNKDRRERPSAPRGARRSRGDGPQQA